VYRQRRDALVDALAHWLPGFRVGGVSAGLSAFVTLSAGLDSAAVVAVGRDAGVGVYQMDDELVDADLRASTLVMGFGTLRPAQIQEGVRRLAAALDDQALIRP
jgi:GntR family transcriptional regulator/MocR family aminotransferase